MIDTRAECGIVTDWSTPSQPRQGYVEREERELGKSVGVEQAVYLVINLFNPSDKVGVA